MTRKEALLIVWDLANENRLPDKEQEPDLVAIREEHDLAFQIIEADFLK
jgi:hypothetical protein